MAKSLQDLPMEIFAEVFIQLPPFVAHNFKRTCRKANDAFQSSHTAIRAAWIQKYLGIQVALNTPNLRVLEDRAITVSMPEVIPDLVIISIARVNIARPTLRPIKVSRDDILAVQEVLGESDSRAKLRDVYNGKIRRPEMHHPFTSGMKTIEQAIKRSLGLRAGWRHKDVRAIRANTICGGLHWVWRMLEGKADLDQYRHAFKPLSLIHYRTLDDENGPLWC